MNFNVIIIILTYEKTSIRIVETPGFRNQKETFEQWSDSVSKILDFFTKNEALTDFFGLHNQELV